MVIGTEDCLDDVPPDENLSSGKRCSSTGTRLARRCASTSMTVMVGRHSLKGSMGTSRDAGTCGKAPWVPCVWIGDSGETRTIAIITSSVGDWQDNQV